MPTSTPTPVKAAPKGPARRRCGAPGCTTKIPAGHIMCGPDWALLPALLRRNVHYAHKGRELDRDSYRAALRQARRAVQAAKNRITTPETARA
ncbi:hypothetical protein [Sphaerisporangium aureirubrum]|uniref:Uncharacterized protein n=1 Tax=Sphaerisporangium aureirubrum TaxID=1544736 RepID=A0ABW1NEF4_9ACTN